VRALALAASVTVALAWSAWAQAPGDGVDIARYYPGAMARSHDLVAGDGARTSYEFPSSWDVERGGFFTRRSDDCADWHLWVPDGLHYLGVDCRARRLNVMILPITHQAFPRRPSLPWSRDFPTWEVSITGDTAAVGPQDLMRVSLARGALDGEPAIVLQFARRNGSGETWWFVDCIVIHPEGGCGPGMRRLLAFDAAKTVWWDRRYVRWGRKP